jgi:hypothetical protein
MNAMKAYFASICFFTAAVGIIAESMGLLSDPDAWEKTIAILLAAIYLQHAALEQEKKP